ncbi:tripartite tricarboxylate transporter substrate binding protein [Achromobacter insolitus]|jgi:tripartite-type tricarboxylate transporter receptor subunit TctC|uniref:ABC transporter substrate-binding protein n=1 Tax=Achromobacter insolitus TaxID=217204 RepID=A0A6S7FE66_9BURK|nr:tripartite tricarboxylate transporter substrate binding protein [Achromobacter insolitus]APX75530.1 ABC transporter substrate-binding protein [Achromobacter insolitus]AVG40473.1 tripartite tricarboxylate transporter substrate binding protein [Achromobacter insolitus]MCP1402151.1 tripartite-type tricarboxylate transporter receptor subunit TctC [Achromobacter insolitus]MDH3063483.1 tripartite tricarboxylate transporter substrate binding protein [Achromobacter insolitus]NGT15880.1 tripartite t
MNTARALLASAALAGACTLAPTAAADYPDRPVKVIVAFSPGGTTDTLTRSVTNTLTQKLGQPFVVENKPGAGGNIGTEYVVRAAADGHTLIVNSVGPIAVNPSLNKLPYSPLTDLVPMVQIATVPNVLVVPPSFPAQDIQGFLKYVKTARQLNYSSTGVGTSSHLSSYMLMDELGVNATHVPYKGADAVNDLLAGRIDFMFATIPSVIGHIRAGKLRALAVSTSQRSATLPDLPTIAESGYPGFDAGSWFGFFAPKGTPQQVVDVVNREVNAALPGLNEQMLREGAEPVGGSPAQFGAFIQREHDKWAVLVRKFAPEAH